MQADPQACARGAAERHHVASTVLAQPVFRVDIGKDHLVVGVRGDDRAKRLQLPVLVLGPEDLPPEGGLEVVVVGLVGGRRAVQVLRGSGGAGSISAYLTVPG